MNLLVTVLNHRQQVLEAIHRHPRAMGAATTGGAISGCWRLNQGLVGGQLLHLVENAVVGGNDKLIVGQRLYRMYQLRGRAHNIGHLDHRIGRFRMHQNRRIRIQRFQILQPPVLELFMYDA